MRGGSIFALAGAAVLACSAAFAAEPPKPVSNDEVHALDDAQLIQLVTEQTADFIATAPSDPHNVAAFSELAKILKLDPATPPSVLAGQVRAQLPGRLAIYYHSPDEKKAPLRWSLRQIEVSTQPYASSVSGLCRSDSLILSYRAPDRKADAATPMALHQLSVFAHYHALKAPASPIAALAGAAEIKANDAACAALNPGTEEFIGGLHEETAVVRGIWLRNQIDAALTQEVLPFDLVCREGTPADKCRQTFQEYMKTVSQVRDCDAIVCTLGVDHGVRDAVATLEPGVLPKIRSLIVMGMPYPPAPF
jgi:hypothetical protein